MHQRYLYWTKGLMDNFRTSRGKFLHQKFIEAGLVYFVSCFFLITLTSCSAFIDLQTVKTKTTVSTPTLLLLVDSHEDGNRLQMRPIDPTTLSDLPGYAPIDFGHHYETAFSPDGQTLAAIVWPSQWSDNGALHLIRLSPWEDHKAGIRFNNHVSMLNFSPDGSSLYWIAATGVSPAHGLPGEYKLFKYDLAAQKESVILSIPFVPADARIFASGSRLTIYGVPVDDMNLAADWPYLMIVDLAAQEMIAKIQLDGSLDGQRQANKEGGVSPYQSDRAGLAWDLDHNRVYIVHPTEDRVKIVDLARAEVIREVEIQPFQSALDRILSFFTSPAQAKAVPGTERRSVLSPSGAHLYIVSLRRELEEQTEGQMIWREVPLGLQVIETRRMHEIRRIDLPFDSASLSPDGQQILLTGSQYQTIFNESYKIHETGLYLFDTSDFEPIFLLQPPNEKFMIHGFSPNNRYAYFSSFDSDDIGGLRLQVLDLNSLKIAGERSLPSGYGDLLGSIWPGK